ncbi:UNVERIFIED_CONTAM: putative uncharacterized protein ART2 [Sesamum calycinum]|uniref:Uncharacterized protein n=1 Tax=Sesamum calycinum TaxID=2727403 RepID=A0AAW2LZ97_9LAMI
MHTTAVCFVTWPSFRDSGKINKGKGLGHLTCTWPSFRDLEKSPGMGLGHLGTCTRPPFRDKGLGPPSTVHARDRLPGLGETNGTGARGTAARTRSVGDLAIFFLSDWEKQQSDDGGPVVCKGFYPPLDGNCTSRRPTRLVRATAWPTTRALGGPRALLRVGKRTAGVRVASSPDSDLEAFSHNPAHAHVPYWWVGEIQHLVNSASQLKSRHRRIKNVYERLAAQPVIPVNQTSFYPSVPHEISVLVELILGHLRYLLTDVPPQPNSPPDNVFRPDRPAEASLGSKKRGSAPPPIHGINDEAFGYLKRVIVTPAVYPRLVEFLHFDIQSTGQKSHLRPRGSRSQSVPRPARDDPLSPREQLEQFADSRRVRNWDPRAQPSEPILFRGYGSILPTSLAYIVPSTRGCSPWRPDAVMSTTGRGRHSVLRIFKGRRGRTGHHATCGALPALDPTSAEPFPGGQAVKQKETLPEAPADVSGLPNVAVSRRVRFRNFNPIPFRSTR